MSSSTAMSGEPSDGVLSSVERYPVSGISVLIVGGGVAGLYAALECWRKGHDVQLLERNATLATTGDIFNIGPSATSVFQNWPDMQKEYEKISYDAWVTYAQHTGEEITKPRPLSPTVSMPGRGNIVSSVGPVQSRPKFAAMLYRQVKRLRIPVEFGKRVIDYYEDIVAEKAGVLLESGEKYEADVVIAADGVGSRSWSLVEGETGEAKSSGCAIYRAAYPMEVAMADPILKERFGHYEHPTLQFWVGKEMHAAIFTSHDLVSWSLTYYDTTNEVGESWHNIVSQDAVLQTMAELPSWSSHMTALVQTTPEDSIIDWKLMWRNPKPNWTSPGGRMVQIGDAAHSFLPTSGNGATQAMEDAISIAACLQSGGKDNISTATKVHNNLRFARTSCVQKMGFINRERFHKTDWALVAQNPSLIEARLGAWIWKHEPEKYAVDNYAAVVLHLETGTGFENTNGPRGYVYKPWTIEELLAAAAEGKHIVDEGEWF